MQEQSCFSFAKKYRVIKRIYYPCNLWEDLKNGQYKTSTHENEIVLEDLCVDLLSNTEKLYHSMRGVISDWFYAMRENISNKEINRQAWLGQAACCYQFGAPDYITKRAWFRLTNHQRVAANNIADKVIEHAEQIIIQEQN